MSDFIKRKSIRNLYSCLNPNDRVLVGQVLIDIDAIPSAEPSWVDALAELHEQFSALEKELRRASAEMSAVIRECVDRPKGEWKEREMFHNADDNPIIEEWQSARCSVCNKYHTTPYMYYFDSFNFCPNCGADMRGERADEHGRNKSTDRQ